MAKKSKAKRKAGKNKSDKNSGLPVKDSARVEVPAGVTPLRDIAHAEEGKNQGKGDRVGMTFEVSQEFRYEYKLFALRRNMTMGEMFQEAFEFYRKLNPSK